MENTEKLVVLPGVSDVSKVRSLFSLLGAFVLPRHISDVL